MMQMMKVVRNQRCDSDDSKIFLPILPLGVHTWQRTCMAVSGMMRVMLIISIDSSTLIIPLTAIHPLARVHA